jgi:hypothetical protein
MATYFARKAGNINAADVWATTPSGTAAAVTFAAGDVLMANSFAITVNVTTNLGAAGQLRNDTTGGATAGGSFALSSGVTLTANIFSGAASCVSLNGGTFTIYGNLTGGTGTTTGAVASHGNINNLSIFGNITGGNGNNAAGVICVSSTLNLQAEGNIVGGSGNLASGVAYTNSGSGNTTVVGTVTGGTFGSASGISTSLTSNTVNVTGVVTGGALTTNSGCSVLGVLNINGLAVGGIAGAGVSAGTAVTATRAVGNGFGLGSVGLTGAPGIANTGTAVVEVRELEYGSRGMSPVTGIVRLKKDSLNQAIFNWVDSGAAKTLVDATQGQMPAISNVRVGVSYASGALTGTCAVPSPATVATGVPVDNTFGTAALSASDVATAVWAAATRTITGGLVDTATTLTNAPTVPSVVQIRQEMDSNSTKLSNLDASVSSRLAPSGTLATVTNLTNAPASVTPSDIWSHATRTLTTSSGPTATEIRQEMDSNSTKLANLDATVSSRLSPSGTLAVVTTLTNAPSVPTPSQIASQVRSELSVELARVDAAITTRATPANIPAADITAIKAKTDALNVDRVNNTATLSQVGNLLAQANS